MSTPSLSGSPVPEVGKPSTGIIERTQPPTNPVQTPPPNGPSRLRQESNKDAGRFILGPRDDLDTLDDLEEGSPVSESDANKSKTRIVHRTLHVRLGDGSGGDGHARKLEAVIYVVRVLVARYQIRLANTNTAPTFHVHLPV
jgi:hypothetical protein